ncbi:AMP-binding protein [Rubellimicrobium roseum]|uniref:AMP-binding protein n=1 Tax=Rubellimicrobium roseum TaxID=687525 RepID=A0A5C4NQQ8_9RHOB|nr:AMP-binding protein [Rubellimicrobium roseum]TNC74739.1 AMP-binding protein [Rubellimicrobium roseum]
MIPDFVRDLHRYGDRPALLVSGRAPVSYADLAAQVVAVAARLPGPRRLVAVEAASDPQAIAAYLGTLLAGHAVALLPPGDAAAREGLEARFRPDWTFRRDGGRWRLLPSGRPAGEAPHPDLALLLQTSGSTGQGKGVRLSGGALQANAESIAEYLGLTPGDRAALVLPLHYSYGLSVLHSHLTVGASLWLHPCSVRTPGFLDGLTEARCTSLAGVPHTYDLLDGIGFRSAALPDLRLLTVAGGRLDPDRVRLWARHMTERDGRFVVMYGQTEATARIAWLPPHLAQTHPDAIGVAIPGGRLSLRGLDGARLDAPEAEGELVYEGPNIMMGYAERREDLSRPSEVTELRTGDLARRDQDGLFRIVGRLRRMSKIGGHRIGHDAVEAALAAKGVAAAVTGDDRRLLVAFAGTAVEDEVAALAVHATGLTLRHVTVLRLAELPRLPSGKVDYAGLRGRLEDRGPDLARAFRDCFAPARVGSGHSFASLGGDSLRHVELSLELQRTLGHVPAGWETMTLAELSALAPCEGEGSALGSDLVLRALAIVAVVTQHQTGWPVYGGAAAMVVLVGLGLGRFGRVALVEGDFARFFRPLLRVLGAYYLILAGYALAWGQVPWASVALVGNFGFADPTAREMLPHLYWFVEAYTQMLLVVALPFLWPGVRARVARDPFPFGLALLAAAMAARLLGPELWPIGGRQIFTLPWVFYLCALGWCVATADTARRRWIVLMAAAAVMPTVAYLGGNWYGAWIKYSALLAVVGWLLFLPRLRLPAALHRPILAVAQASFLVYLLHRLVPELLMPALGLDLSPGVTDAVAVAGGVGVGLLAAWGQGALLRRAGPWLAALGRAMPLRGAAPRRA